MTRRTDLTARRMRLAQALKPRAILALAVDDRSLILDANDPTQVLGEIDLTRFRVRLHIETMLDCPMDHSGILGILECGPGRFAAPEDWRLNGWTEPEIELFAEDDDFAWGGAFVAHAHARDETELRDALAWAFAVEEGVGLRIREGGP